MPFYVRLVLLACVCYAVENVLIDRYLRDITAAVNVAIFNTFLMMVSWSAVMGFVKTGTAMTVPQGRTQWIAAGACAVLYSIAEFSFIGSYSKGGTANTVPIFAVAIPVVAMFIGSIWDRQLPDWRAVVALLLIFGAVLLISQIPEKSS